VSEANPVGRPTAYEDRFSDELEAFMAQGYSFTAFAGSIGVCRNTLDNWAKDHPEFLGARQRAKAKRLLHWETAGLTVAKDGGGPGAATMVTFGLKNMGDGEWVDAQRQEHTGPDGGPIRTQATVDMSSLSEEQLRVLASVPIHRG
jgi:hypothetical protein